MEAESNTVCEGVPVSRIFVNLTVPQSGLNLQPVAATNRWRCLALLSSQYRDRVGLHSCPQRSIARRRNNNGEDKCGCRTH